MILQADDGGVAADVNDSLSNLTAALWEHYPVQPKSKSEFAIYHFNLNAFLIAVVDRRRTRTASWLKANMQYFLEDPEAKQMLQKHRLIMDELQQIFTLCGQKFKECYMYCTRSQRHSGDHDCLQSRHTCSHPCHYCKLCPSTMEESVLCGLPAGHQGPHNCGSKDHVCGKNCHLFDLSWNCMQRCSQLPGHEGECDCGSGNHMCSQQCSLDGCTERCSKPFGEEHDRHACISRRCPATCALCNLTCSSSNH